MKDRPDAILQRAQAEYLDTLLPPRDALLDRMEAFAREEGHPIADPEVAQLMRVVLRIVKPRRVLEIGTNIGYSVVVIGRECGAGTIIETIELNRDTVAKAKGFVGEAALSSKIVFHEGAALDVIPRLQGSFDFVFIDCVKTEYEQYLDGILPRLEKGSVVFCDNLLWKGQIATGARDASTDALRGFNRRITTDERLVTTVLAVGDGVGISVVK